MREGGNLNFITTILNENYWNPWGISWISSLIEFADTKAKIIVVDCGLSAKTLKKLIELGVTVLPHIEANGFQKTAFLTVKKFDNNKGNKYLFFDADIWFQLPVDELFDQIDDRFLICKNLNYGFLGFSSESFNKFDMIQTFCSYTHDDDVFACLVKHFPYSLNKIDNKYNFNNLPELKTKDGMLVFNEEPQVTIHFQGVLKTCSGKKNLLYHERYPDLFAKYNETKKFISKIVTPKQKSDVNHNNSE